MDKIKEIVDITNFSLNPLEDENEDLIVFGYNNQPMILLDLIPKDIKKLIQEIKNKVIINSGMNNKVAEKIFKSFWNEGNIDFNAINHAQKNKALRKVYSRLDFYFNHLKRSKNTLMYLKSLPFIGDITKYHLARNLGLNVAKPDRHLIRIAKAFGYSDVQKFCRKISFLSGDKIGVVDLVFWRYATITSNYLEIIEKTLKKEL